MASGSPAGFGRGGRGKSLMELLNQQVRKPGQTPSEPQVGHSTVFAVVSQATPLNLKRLKGVACETMSPAVCDTLCLL